EGEQKARQMFRQAVPRRLKRTIAEEPKQFVYEHDFFSGNHNARIRPRNMENIYVSQSTGRIGLRLIHARAMASHPKTRQPGAESTPAVLQRLWREHLRHHKPRLLVVMVLTGIMAGMTALYPLVINHAME